MWGVFGGGGGMRKRAVEGGNRCIYLFIYLFISNIYTG